jgi:hypothetical protein
MVRGFKNVVVYLMKWIEGRIRKKLGMLAVNLKVWAGSEYETRWEL